MGWNSQPTRMVIMEDVRVPAANVLGGVDAGFKIAMAGLNGGEGQKHEASRPRPLFSHPIRRCLDLLSFNHAGRINIASCSVGGAQAALGQTLDYVRDRQQFGKPLAANQAVQFRLADIAAKLNASRQVVRLAARELDKKNRWVPTQAQRMPVVSSALLTSVLLPAAAHRSFAPWPS